jgi:hypothetical protein
MDFKEAESKYFESKGRLDGGTLTPEQFQAQVRELSVQDEEGRYWAIDAGTGGWLCYDGTNWVPSQPPPGVSSLAPPARAAAPPQRRAPLLVIGAVAVAAVLCLVSLCGGWYVLNRPSAGPEEEAAVVSQEEAESIADELIAEEFPDLADAEKTMGSYENPAGTDFWTVTYRKDVETQAEGQTYTIPRIVVVSVDKDTGDSIAAVSD